MSNPASLFYQAAPGEIIGKVILGKSGKPPRRVWHHKPTGKEWEVSAGTSAFLKDIDMIGRAFFGPVNPYATKPGATSSNLWKWNYMNAIKKFRKTTAADAIKAKSYLEKYPDLQNVTRAPVHYSGGIDREMVRNIANYDLFIRGILKKGAALDKGEQVGLSIGYLGGRGKADSWEDKAKDTIGKVIAAPFAAQVAVATGTTDPATAIERTEKIVGATAFINPLGALLKGGIAAMVPKLGAAALKDKAIQAVEKEIEKQVAKAAGAEDIAKAHNLDAAIRQKAAKDAAAAEKRLAELVAERDRLIAQRKALENSPISGESKKALALAGAGLLALLTLGG